MDGGKFLRPRSLCSWRTRDRQPWDLAPNNDDVEAGAVPFQLRFWMQELIFAHCPCLPRPCLSGNLLSRVDRLSLRGIAGCERAVLPILEIASNVLQRRAEQLRDAPPGARDPACTERTPTDLSESQQDSFQTDRRNNEYAGEAVPFQPRFLATRTYLCPLSTPASCDILPTRILATTGQRDAGKQSSSVGRLPVRRTLRALRRRVATNCPLQKHSPQPTQDSGHNTLRATERLCLAIGDLRPQHFWLRNKQKILSHVGSAKTLGGGRPYTTPAGPCIAYSSRPLGTDHERERRDPGGIARAARTGGPPASPLARPRFRQPQRGLPAVADAAGRAALKGRADCFSPTSSSAVATTARLEQHCGIGGPRTKQSTSPYHLAPLFDKCLDTEGSHRQLCVKPLFSQDFLSCFVRTTWTVLPRVRPGVRRKRGGITRRGFTFTNMLTSEPRLKLKSRRRKVARGLSYRGRSRRSSKKRRKKHVQSCLVRGPSYQEKERERRKKCHARSCQARGPLC